MTVVAPAQPRTLVTETLARLEIVVPARKHWLTIAFLVPFLCAWAFGGFMAATQFVGGGAPLEARLFLVAWLCGWMVAGGAIVYQVCWSIAGRERLSITRDRLAVKRELFGRGRVREYELLHVRRLRVDVPVRGAFDPPSGMMPFWMQQGSIAFDHGSATVRIGAELDESEALDIVDRIRARTGLA